LYGYYRRHYVPNNATLVIVGDVDTDEALRRVDRYFGAITPATRPPASAPSNRSRRENAASRYERKGTTAYLKVGYHAPSATDPLFAPLLILDAGAARVPRASTSGQASACPRRNGAPGSIACWSRKASPRPSRVR
jgi:hypothetical protein